MYEGLKNELNIDVPRTPYEIHFGKKNQNKSNSVENTKQFTDLIEKSTNDSDSFEGEFRRMVEESQLGYIMEFNDKVCRLYS